VQKHDMLLIQNLAWCRRNITQQLANEIKQRYSNEF
jgi:hypothetical protein